MVQCGPSCLVTLSPVSRTQHFHVSKLWVGLGRVQEVLGEQGTVQP